LSSFKMQDNRNCSFLNVMTQLTSLTVKT